MQQRPGGVVAACVWDYAGDMTLLRAFWDAAREVDPKRAVVADEGVVMRWCAEGELAELWRAAGLSDVRFGPLVVSATYTNFEDLWSPFPTGVAPSGGFCTSLEADRRAALHDAYRRPRSRQRRVRVDRARLGGRRHTPPLTPVTDPTHEVDPTSRDEPPRVAASRAISDSAHQRQFGSARDAKRAWGDSHHVGERAGMSPINGCASSALTSYRLTML
jgi:hypothetical protein